jgi:hypothetical protein
MRIVNGVTVNNQPTKQMKTIRDIAAISLLNPLNYGDAIELDGSRGSDLWIVDRSSAGWYLKLDDSATVATRHPTIHSIDGMLEFITAILYAAKV